MQSFYKSNNFYKITLYLGMYIALYIVFTRQQLTYNSKEAFSVELVGRVLKVFSCFKTPCFKNSVLKLELDVLPQYVQIRAVLRDFRNFP